MIGNKREPILMCATGKKGVGKTFTTTLLIDSYTSEGSRGSEPLSEAAETAERARNKASSTLIIFVFMFFHFLFVWVVFTQRTRCSLFPMVVLNGSDTSIRDFDAACADLNHGLGANKPRERLNLLTRWRRPRSPLRRRSVPCFVG